MMAPPTEDASTNSTSSSTPLMDDFVEALHRPEEVLLPLLLSSASTTTTTTIANNTTNKLRLLCQVLFGEIEHQYAAQRRDYLFRASEDADSRSSYLSGLDQLFLGESNHNSSSPPASDVETLWGQVELQTEALLPVLRKRIKRLGRKAAASDNNNNSDRIRLLDMEDEEEEEEEGLEADDALSGNQEEDEEEEDQEEAGEEHGVQEDGEEEVDYDEETKRIKERMERAMADMDDDDDDDDEQSDESDTEEKKRSAAREVSTKEEEELVDPVAKELNDGFFDIQEMEDSADEEEAFLPEEAFGQAEEEEPSEPKKSLHQRQREGGELSDDDEEEEEEGLELKQASVPRRKYREAEDIEALYSLYQEANSDDEDGEEEEDDVVNMTAAAFFGKPDKKYIQNPAAKKNENKADLKKSMILLEQEMKGDADSWDDHDFENEGPDWRDSGQSHEVNGERESGTEGMVNVDDESSADGESNGAGDDTEKETAATTGPPSMHARQTGKLRRQTELLEQEMMAEKPWQMTGEIASGSRPVNSLLESTPEFEVATKMAPAITVEHTQNLEDVIKQRILNEEWDDIVPRELPDIGWKKNRGELPEVSQEKSKLGLGELYEREYLKKAVGYDADAAEKQTEQDKAQNEMKALFANLCSKLDALSNYHFAPRPIADEADVRPATTPAIAMEEVMPLHVSDARGVAPEEVYGAKKGREGVLKGETELDKAERKRLRNAKKAARRKKRKEKLADEKLISRLQPGLGLNNPYEKRKMREELSLARARGKVTTGTVDAAADYGAGSSTKFFQHMQEEAQASIRIDNEGGPKRKKQKTAGEKSSAFKL